MLVTPLIVYIICVLSTRYPTERLTKLRYWKWEVSHLKTSQRLQKSEKGIDVEWSKATVINLLITATQIHIFIQSRTPKYFIYENVQEWITHARALASTHTYIRAHTCVYIYISSYHYTTTSLLHFEGMHNSYARSYARVWNYRIMRVTLLFNRSMVGNLKCTPFNYRASTESDLRNLGGHE